MPKNAAKLNVPIAATPRQELSGALAITRPALKGNAKTTEDVRYPLDPHKNLSRVGLASAIFAAGEGAIHRNHCSSIGTVRRAVGEWPLVAHSGRLESTFSGRRGSPPRGNEHVARGRRGHMKIRTP